jgi:hypothetical protein
MPKALVFQEAHIQTPNPPVSKVTGQDLHTADRHSQAQG